MPRPRLASVGPEYYLCSAKPVPLPLRNFTSLPSLTYQCKILPLYIQHELPWKEFSQPRSDLERLPQVSRAEGKDLTIFIAGT